MNVVRIYAEKVFQNTGATTALTWTFGHNMLFFFYWSHMMLYFDPIGQFNEF